MKDPDWYRFKMEELQAELGHEDAEYRTYSRPVQKAGDVFTGKDGRRWERYVAKSGKLSVKPYNG